MLYGLYPHGNSGRQRYNSAVKTLQKANNDTMILSADIRKNCHLHELFVCTYYSAELFIVGKHYNKELQ